ncbi:hypothetical protein LSH36_9g12031 [Paralvinella palmiformis]|uniref:Uncharacterized protein n=1 Tax=Paralvinella palmiformis TaxID=53620 RepID=A0AAD9KEC9_9ANNE|nr:hypothetical protein LSH36_9g12031 [Paralvinella palmiformis]
MKDHEFVFPFPRRACPTCTQYYQLESSVQELYKVIEELNKKLLETEIRLTAVEKCECLASCKVNGTKYRDGESWKKDHCTTCTCRGGQVSCVPPICPKPKCKHPVLKEGACCPTCLHTRRQFSIYAGRHVGDNPKHFWSSSLAAGWIPCDCLPDIWCLRQPSEDDNGRMTCHREEQCPPLDCPPEQQVAVEGECCKFCKGLDYCGKGHDCHQNATCYNLDTKYTCQCNDGFKGDGKTCQDLDECQSEGGHHGHYCHSNTKCINTPGSYKCECLPGYVRESQFACRELDECHLGLHDCHPNADCINTEGSFICRCSPGYHGDGKLCQPSCPEPCLNGGTCVAPGVCACRVGYVGDHCQTDVNECEEGLARCHPNSDCINIPGQYYCKCKKGFHSDHYDNLNGLLCRDVNECGGWGGGHHCPTGTECTNTPGGYECLCREHSECSAACQVDGEFHANGTVWEMFNEPCSQCVCKDGEVRCSRRPCDCAAGFSDPKCCPHCAPEQQCRHQDLPMTYYSGDTWIYQCQMCECLNGEVDCWALECPPLSCSKVVHEDGDCCPRCVDEDPCRVSVDPDDVDRVSMTSMVCFFDSKKYFSGDSWLVPWDNCSMCTCQAGQICCTYNESCSSVKQTHPALVSHLYEGSFHRARSFNWKPPETAAPRITEKQSTYPEEVEPWQLRRVAGTHDNGQPRYYEYGPRVEPNRERPRSADHPSRLATSRISADHPQPGIDRGGEVNSAPGADSHLTATNIPSRELPYSNNNPNSAPLPKGSVSSVSGTGNGHISGEMVSVARLKNSRTSNSELSSGDVLVRSSGPRSPPDTPTTDVGSASAVLSHARESRSYRRKLARRQGRRGLRKRRKRPRLSSAPRSSRERPDSGPSPSSRFSRERLQSSPWSPTNDWSLLERELRTLTNGQPSGHPKDKREKSTGRRRKNFDGVG